MKGKHVGNLGEYTQLRHDSLLRAYRKAIAELSASKRTISLTEVIERARMSPAPRYFVSEERAMIILPRIFCHWEWRDMVRAWRTDHPADELPQDLVQARPADPFSYMQFRKGQEPYRCTMKMQTKRMFVSLAERCNELRAAHPEESLRSIVYKACASPAPEFFLTLYSARTIINKLTKPVYQRRAKKQKPYETCRCRYVHRP